MIHRFSRTSGVDNHLAAQGMSNRNEVDREFPLIQVHDPDSPDIGFAVRNADELINISGALVTIYLRTDNAVDEVWDEDADPTYKSGHKLKGYFVPQPLAAQLTPWGVDAPNQTTVVFSRGAIVDKFTEERMVRVGDLIELPYNGSVLRPQRYRVLNSFDSGNFRYTWLYFSCLVESISADKTIDIDHR